MVKTLENAERNPYTGQPGKWVNDPTGKTPRCFVEAGSGRVFHDGGVVMQDERAAEVARKSPPLSLDAMIQAVKDRPQDATRLLDCLERIALSLEVIAHQATQANETHRLSLEQAENIFGRAPSS